MTDLKVFNDRVLFRSWIEIYIGINKNWISGRDVLFFIETKKIISVSDSDFIELYIALDVSLGEFLGLIIKKINKAYNINSTADPDRPINNLELLHAQLGENFFDFYKIWELEFLIRIRDSQKEISEKIYDIYLLWCDFKYYKVMWDDFLWFSEARNETKQGEQKLYENFLSYSESLAKELKK